MFISKKAAKRLRSYNEFCCCLLCCLLNQPFKMATSVDVISFLKTHYENASCSERNDNNDHQVMELFTVATWHVYLYNLPPCRELQQWNFISSPRIRSRYQLLPITVSHLDFQSQMQLLICFIIHIRHINCCLPYLRCWCCE